MYKKASNINELRENFAIIEERLQQACLRAGRDRKSLRLLPISKTVPVEILRDCCSLNYRQFGENKVQEALQKWELMQDCQAEWVIVGHLQKNKAKYVAKFAQEFQALDNLELAQLLHKRLEEQNRDLKVLVQINTSGEESKFGIKSSQAEEFITQLSAFPRLKVSGLMTLALLSEHHGEVRRCFVELRETAEKLKRFLPENMTMDELSMGMSGDFEIAIEEGATTVRIGQALFGARKYPDSYYWNENK